jgi:hypothetical protein
MPILGPTQPPIHSLEKWKKFILEDMEIKISSHSIKKIQLSQECLHYVSWVFTGPHMHILVVHITIKTKIGLITEPNAFGVLLDFPLRTY